jgi:hypothetical protein
VRRFTANHAAIYGKCCDFRKFAGVYGVAASLGTILANLPRGRQRVSISHQP